MMIIERQWTIVKGLWKDNGKTKTDYWKTMKIIKDY